MEKRTLYCDICKKETWYDYIYVTIFAGDERKYELNGAWNYQRGYNLLICKDCIGSEITRCNGSHSSFSIKDMGINLLKKLKMIKNT